MHILLIMLLGLMAWGCSIHPDMAKQYHLAIMDASVIESDEMVTLPVIHGNEVQMVTWTKYPNSYVAGNQTRLKWGEVWVTLDGAVKSQCRLFQKDSLVSQVQQLLGLPLVKNETRYFVTMSVASTDLFRPCADPSIIQPSCSGSFPENVSAAHKAWYAGQVAEAYISPNGYPWTRLGYTYDWSPDRTEVGPAEFVIRKGAVVTTTSVVSTEAYCN